ncbi:hypothetical protein [Streptomyces sp. NPDC054863]
MDQYGQGQQGPVPPTAPGAPGPHGAFGPPQPGYQPPPQPGGHQPPPQPGGHQPPPHQAYHQPTPPPQGYQPTPPPQGYQPAPPHLLHAPAPGPEFIAADAHFGVVIDAAGVAFDADGQLAEFPWHELGTVQYRPSPVGQRLMVAAVLPDGRFFECVVNARKAAVLQQWLAQIAYVTSHYLATRGGFPG